MLQNQLVELHHIPVRSKGKRKADEVEVINYEEMAKSILSQGNRNQTMIENEVQKQVDAHQAQKQSRIDRGALAAQADKELWGHTSSAEDQGIP